MNEYLEKALKELNEAKADGLPPIDEIINAADGSNWSGSLSEGGSWKLIKHNENSYTNNTRSGED